MGITQQADHAAENYTLVAKVTGSKEQVQT
jgi:hypothetical protein